MVDNVSAGSICAPVFSYKSHSHPLWELVYYTSGEGSITIDDVTYPYESGMVFAIPPNTVHSDRSPGGYTNLYINFFSDELPSSPFFAADNSSRDIYNIMLILQREYMLHLKNHDDILFLLLETVLAYMKALAVNEDKNDYVEEMKQTIIDNYTDSTFSLQKMYNSMSINSDYARRLFVKETGTTPINYIKHLRVKKAKELLQMKDLKFSIFDVAAQSGFTDQYHFSKVFKQTTGLSPRAWKNQYTAQ